MKELDKKLIINNWFRSVFQTFFETENWRKWDAITMESSRSLEAVFVCALTNDKKIIYINEYRFWPKKNMFMFVCWWIEKKESLEQWIIRELEEEAWYTSDNFKYLGTYINHWYMDWKNHLFLALDCEKIINQNLQDIEEIEVFTISIEWFEQMLKNNEINCPWSELAFRKAKELTNNFTNFDI